MAEGVKPLRELVSHRIIERANEMGLEVSLEKLAEAYHFDDLDPSTKIGRMVMSRLKEALVEPINSLENFYIQVGNVNLSDRSFKGASTWKLLNCIVIKGNLKLPKTLTDTEIDFSAMTHVHQVSDLDLQGFDGNTAIRLINGFRPTRAVNLTGVNFISGAELSLLESTQIQDLNWSFSHSRTDVSPDVIVTLLSKFNPSGDVDFSAIDLRGLTSEHVMALPDGMRIQGLCLSSTRIHPTVMIELVAKLNPWGDVDFPDNNLRELTSEDVMRLPDGMKIQGLDLSSTHIYPDVMVKLLSKLNPSGDVNFAAINLGGLTSEHVMALPDEMRIQGLCLNGTQIHPTLMVELFSKLNPSGRVWLESGSLSDLLTHEHLMAIPNEMKFQGLYMSDARIPPVVMVELLAKLNLAGEVRVSYQNLSSITSEHVAALPDGMKSQDVNLRHTKIYPNVLVELLTKLNPSGNVYLESVNLGGLTVEDVMGIPNGMEIQDLDLSETNIKPNVFVALLTKLNPSGNVYLESVNLGGLTVEDVMGIPDGMEIQDLDLSTTNIKPNVWVVLLAKLRPSGDVLSSGVNLGGLTREEVMRILNGMEIRNLDLLETNIKPDVLAALREKLNPSGCVEFSNVRLPRGERQNVRLLRVERDHVQPLPNMRRPALLANSCFYLI